MIKFNIECAFSEESGSRQSNIVPQLENQSSETEKSQYETRLTGISAGLKDLKQIQKEMRDDILKAEEVLNLQLRGNSEELNLVALNTQSCLKIIEQIAIDSTKLRECLEMMRESETRRPLEESTRENGEYYEEVNQTKCDNQDNQVGDIRRLKDPEVETKVNQSGVCEKGTQSDGKLVSSELLNTFLNKRDKEDIKEVDVLEPTKLQNDCIVKCCYCDESHLKTNSKQKAREKSEKEVEISKENECKISLPLRGVHNSNTWPLNKTSLYDFGNGNEDTEKSAILKIKSQTENEGRARQSQINRRNGTAVECSDDTQAPVELLEQTNTCQNVLEMEVIPSFSEDKLNSFSDKILVDDTKCKVCKSTSCNLNKPLRGKYSPSTPFKFSQYNKLGTNVKCVGASQQPWSNNKCHQSSSQKSGTCQNFSFTKNTQSSPLNVANDLCKRHLKNCTVHGCVSPLRPVEGFKGKSCHGEQFSSSECAKVNSGFSCHNLYSGIKKEEEGVTITKLSDKKCEGNQVCKDAFVNKSGFGTKVGEVRSTDGKTDQCNPKSTSTVDSFKNITCFKRDENNNKPSNGIFSTSKRKVLALAQEAKRNKEYKFMWFRGGKVFMKKEDNSPIVTISNLSDLDNL